MYASNDLPQGIDQQQAIAHLSSLGYKRGDKVYIRYIHPVTKKSIKASRLDFAEANRYQAQGYDAYFVVNGGGDTDKAVTRCRIIFYEHDDLDKSIQLLLWQTLGLPEPTIQIDTGGKSIHSYWLLTEDISPEQWRQLQADLLEYSDGDRTLKNPSRIMRLAGSWYMKGDNPGSTVACIVSNSGQQYTYSQLRAAIPQANPEQPTLPQQGATIQEKDIVQLIGEYIPLEERSANWQWRGDCPFCGAVEQFIVKPQHQTFRCLNCSVGGDADNGANTAAHFLKRYSALSGASPRIRYKEIQVPVPEEVPLEVCLSRDSRQLLQYGVGEGGRNGNGAKLARDLIGTANYLQDIGQRFNGDPWQLFLDYCHRCPSGNGWNSSEWKNIWKSAQGERPTPSCKAEGVETCIRAWYWNNHVKPSPLTRGASNVVLHPARNQAGGDGNPPQSSGNAPYALVKELVSSGLTTPQLSGALIELANSTGYQLGGLKDLAREIEAEFSSESAQSDDAKETSKLVDYREQTLDLKRIFPETLANFLLTKADSDRIDPVFIYQYLWSAIGLSLGAHIGIEAKKGSSEADNWVEFPIYYNMTVAPPSSGKSQTMRSVLGPVKRKQDKERASYKKAQKHLEKLKQDWLDKSPEDKERLKDSIKNPKVYESQMPPPPQVQLIEAGTPEGAFKRMSELPPMSGVALAFDELVRILSLDQYKNQGGDTRQTLMESWSHPYSTEFQRSDDKNTTSLEKICINITGGIQKALAKKIVSDPDDGDGLLSRFLIAVTKLPDNFAVWSSIQVEIDQALSELYQFLGQIHFDLRKRVYGDNYIQSIVDGEQILLRFDAAASNRWQQWWEHVRSQMRQVEHENPALFGYLGKMLSQVLRLALGLHCIEMLYSDKPDPLTVGLPTLERAIYAAKFHIGQFRLLQANNDTTNLPGHLAKIYEYALRKGKEVSPTQVQNTVFKRSERKPPLAQIREYFKLLADAVGAKLIGAGKDLKILVQKFVGIPTNSDKKSDQPQTPQSTTSQGIVELSAQSSDNSDISDAPLERPSTSVGDEWLPTPVMSSDVGTTDADSGDSDTTQGDEPEGDPPKGGGGAPVSPSGSPGDSPGDGDGAFEDVGSSNIFSGQSPTIGTDPDSPNIEKCRNCRNSADEPLPTLSTEQTLGDLVASDLVSESVGNSDSTSNLDDELDKRIASSSLPSGTGFGEANPKQDQRKRSSAPAPQGEAVVVKPRDGNTVCLPDGQMGIATMIYPDGRIGVQFDNGRKFGMWELFELTVVDAPPLPQSDAEHVPAIELKTGMWVRCKDYFYGYLGAQTSDGRWYVSRPKTSKVEAESRLYAATDITPMPPRPR